VNNNPGNLVYAGQAGASPGAGGFAQFSSYQAGRNALISQLQLDAVRGTDLNGNPINNLSDLIYSWAPPSENDSAGYLANVVSQTGFSASAPLSSLGAGDPLFSVSSVFTGGGGLPADPGMDPAGSSFPWTAAAAIGAVVVAALYFR
jgi:hypothetical protein